MSVGRRFITLVAVGVVLLFLMVYLVSFSRPSPVLEKGVKLIHKGHHSNVQMAEIKAQPQKTPTSEGVALAEHVRRTCVEQRLGKQQGASVSLDRFDHILVDERYKMLYCYIPKVACTNWRRVMLVLSGKVKVSNVLDIRGGDVHGRFKRLLPRLSNYSQQEVEWRLSTYYKFMFVREPFERLLSAWRNKFLNGKNPYFRKQFGHSILRRFRDSYETPAAEEEEEEEKEEEGTGSKRDRATGTVRFDEFLQYIVDPLRTEALNEHWATYHRLCLPCSVRYDFVGRYETLDVDAQHVLRAVRADGVVRFPTRSASYKDNQTSSYLAGFYRNLSAPLLRRVYSVYKKDFQLFNFALPPEMGWVFRGEGEGEGEGDGEGEGEEGKDR
ncbi:carbohydrate sulfotransferase 11-like [Babylonia areolata]|uniref:carbohydrate sulfotransferase 11-like n=1 Tax=Babylonia areolata TaxID=304850 RepID=UPI003FD3C8A1